MEPLEILSESVIDILKEFSTGKNQLTTAALKQAFGARKEILSLISSSCNACPNVGREDSGPARIPKATPKTELLPEFQNAFLQVLDSLGPMINGDNENRFNELQNKINQCESLIPLCGLGEQIGAMINGLINEAVERIDYANDFLVELSNDLYKMEEQLLSYQNYNKETHQIAANFHSDILSQAGDMHQALDSVNNLHDVRNLITSKLHTISQAIDTKQQSDEVRLREADTKITELQKNIKTYNQEIVQIREHATSLEKEVLLDELTQINNRRSYDLQIRESLRRYQRTGELFSLILIDIDHFKRINDNYGHKAGDICLTEIAKLIKTSLRQSDFLARYGGEELVVILKGTNLRNARNVAEKIRFRIENTRFYYQEKIISITISLGVTEVLPGDTDPGVPFIRVDEAMYRAKKAGRNRVCEVAELPVCKIPGNKLATVPNG